MRDAVLLAVELSTSLRRSEFQAITLDVMFFKAEAQVTIVIPEFASKVRRVQLGLVRDPRVVAMLRQLKSDKAAGALFETNWATPLASASKYKALKRAGERAVGVALNFNKVRRIGVTSETSTGAMRKRLRHVNGSEVAEQTYAWHPDDVGIEECRAKLSQYGL